MKFQRNNVIDSSSSGTSDEGQMNIVDLMASKNSKHVEIVNKKIQKAVYSFDGKHLKDLDKRIIAGILKRRLSDSDDDHDGTHKDDLQLKEITSNSSAQEGIEHKEDYQKFKRGVRIIPLFSNAEIGDTVSKIYGTQNDAEGKERPVHYYDNES